MKTNINRNNETDRIGITKSGEAVIDAFKEGDYIYKAYKIASKLLGSIEAELGFKKGTRMHEYVYAYAFTPFDYGTLVGIVISSKPKDSQSSVADSLLMIHGYFDHGRFNAVNAYISHDIKNKFIHDEIAAECSDLVQLWTSCKRSNAPYRMVPLKIFMETHDLNDDEVLPIATISIDDIDDGIDITIMY